MDIRRVKREHQRDLCIRFLKEKGARNLYLYEGLVSRNTGHTNLLLARKGKTVGVAHTRSGFHLHLYLSDESTDADIREIGSRLKTWVPTLKSCFGDRAGVERFLVNCGRAVVKTRPFVYMELERGRYDFNRHVPRALHPTVEGEPHMAEALVGLQIQYEIEELGVAKTAISPERTLASLGARIALGEVTLLFEDGRLIACAGVNARFETTCQIGSVYVLPAYRGRGYGYSVVSSHITRMFERYTRVVLFVGEANAAARHIYVKLGFQTAGALLFAELGTWPRETLAAGEPLNPLTP